MSDFDPNNGFVYRAQRVFLWIGALYATLLVLLVLPPVQRQYVVHFDTVPTRDYFDPNPLCSKGGLSSRHSLATLCDVRSSTLAWISL